MAVPPDLILHNANVVTLDSARPRARALSVKGERIVALGTDETIRDTAGPNTVILDARGLTVLPGFNDNHLHALGMGRFFQYPNLFGKNADEIVKALKQHYVDSKPGQQLTGYAWDYSSCPHPNKALLDQAFPNNPVVLRQYSGHAQWLNTLALKELLDAASRSRARQARGPSSGMSEASPPVSCLEPWFIAGIAESFCGEHSDQAFIGAFSMPPWIASASRESLRYRTTLGSPSSSGCFIFSGDWAA